jgi:hypothetical protein
MGTMKWDFDKQQPVEALSESGEKTKLFKYYEENVQQKLGGSEWNEETDKQLFCAQYEHFERDDDCCELCGARKVVKNGDA